MLALPTSGEFIDLFLGVLLFVGTAVFLFCYCFGIYFWVPKKYDSRYSIKIIIKRTALTWVVALAGSLVVCALIYAVADFGFGNSLESLVEEARIEALNRDIVTSSLCNIWFLPIVFCALIVVPFTATIVALNMSPESRIRRYLFRELATVTGGFMGLFLNLYVLIFLGRLLYPFSSLLDLLSFGSWLESFSH